MQNVAWSAIRALRFPKPLQLIRHGGRGSLELIAHEALALTTMDWNNDALYDPVPVSIRYSQRLARTIAYSLFM